MSDELKLHCEKISEISECSSENATVTRSGISAAFSENDMSGCAYDRCNMKGSAFSQSELCGSAFSQVNLSGSAIDNSDLSGVKITGCKLSGAEIDGISVEKLLEFYKQNHKENNNMNKAVRKAVIAGNWKMNKTRPEARELLDQIKVRVATLRGAEIVACVPFTDLEAALHEVRFTNVHIGAQNCHFEKSGAFTGEISADMLKEMGVEYVVLGHSERRQYFGETDETVNKRTKAALEAGLIPIVCVGELLWERECNITEEVIARQIKLDFFDISAEDMKKCVIAYEPVWAIGTGKTATAEQAEEVCAFIRATLAKIYDEETAQAVTIQYGGSMNAKNAAELLAKENVDGGLIGGASLDAEAFDTIVRIAVNG